MPSVTTTETRTITIRPTLKKKLLAELRPYAELKAQAKALEHAMTGHKDRVEVIRDEIGEPNLELEGFKISRVQGDYTSITKELLLQFGIPMSTIEDIWDAARKPKKAFTKITVPGDKNGD